MNLVKSLALGSAAAFVMTAGAAKAADLPGAEPVEYVKICDIKGSTGFFYIPGTETCLQIGGFARLELTTGERPQEDEYANRTGYRVRTRIWFDARTDTEYGAVRTFVRLQFQRESGAQSSSSGNALGQASSATSDDFLFDQAFVQFAGLTAGVTDSFWDFKPYPTFQNPFVSDRTLPVLAYTAKVGDVSASISLEDKTYRYYTANNGTPAAGQTLPDVVANLRVKQGWGEAQISGVLSRINPRESGFIGQSGLDLAPTGLFATGDNEWGWGVQGGLKVNLGTANTSDNKGDYIWGSAAYVDGAGLSYLGLGDANNGSGQTTNVSGFNPQRDYLLINGNTEKTRGFNANLGALHYWSPQWRSALQGTYINVDYRKVNDADWSSASLTGNLIWSPIKKLDIGGELVYIKNLNKGSPYASFGTHKLDDDAFIGRIRVQRDF